MRQSLVVSLVTFLLLLGSSSVWAQSQEPATLEEAARASWKAVQEKILEMAQDFPEDKFDYRPHPDTRNFLEEIWHVTSSAEAVAAQATPDGNIDDSKFDYRKIFSYDGHPHDRAGLVAALEMANNESSLALEMGPNLLITNWIEHSGEHYGKLVNFYRENGLVPPRTRQQEARRRQQQQEQEKEQEQKKQ